MASSVNKMLACKYEDPNLIPRAEMVMFACNASCVEEGIDKSQKHAREPA